MHHRILEGTWTEVSKEAQKLNGNEHVRLEVIEQPKDGKPIQLGMFKELGELTEEDFKAAEWRMPVEEEL